MSRIILSNNMPLSFNHNIYTYPILSSRTFTLQHMNRQHKLYAVRNLEWDMWNLNTFYKCQYLNIYWKKTFWNCECNSIPGLSDKWPWPSRLGRHCHLWDYNEWAWILGHVGSISGVLLEFRGWRYGTITMAWTNINPYGYAWHFTRLQ